MIPLDPAASVLTFRVLTDTPSKNQGSVQQVFRGFIDLCLIPARQLYKIINSKSDPLLSFRRVAMVTINYT